MSVGHTHDSEWHEHEGGNLPHNHREPRDGYGHTVATGVGLGFLVFAGIVWLATNQLVSQCHADLSIVSGTGTCQGLPVIAYHMQSGLDAIALVLGAIGALVLAGAYGRR
jgi:hypothetical protein